MPAIPPTLPLVPLVTASPEASVAVVLLPTTAAILPSPRSTPPVLLVSFEEPSRCSDFSVLVPLTPSALISADEVFSTFIFLPSAVSISTDFFSSRETLPASDTLVFFSSPVLTVLPSKVVSVSLLLETVRPSRP